MSNSLTVRCIMLLYTPLHSRYYKDGSELTLDVGPYMKAMEV